MSFRQAAAQLGVLRLALNYDIKPLESLLLERVGPAYRDIEQALAELDDDRSEPSGTLRLHAGVQGARLVLLPRVARFIARYPKIRVEIATDDAAIDLVVGEHDAGVRLHAVLEADMIALPIGPPMRSVVVAAPELPSRIGRPEHPHDLRRLPCIAHRFGSGEIDRWRFARDNEHLAISPSATLTLDSVDLMLDAARHGLGLAYVFEASAKPYIQTGQLQTVLDAWCPFYPGFHLYYSNRRHLPGPLRAFVDFLRTSDRRET